MKPCKHCNGDGFIPMKDEMYIRSCPVCEGKRYVDWITYAVGYVEKEELIIAAWPAAGTTRPKGPPKLKSEKE